MKFLVATKDGSRYVRKADIDILLQNWKWDCEISTKETEKVSLWTAYLCFSRGYLLELWACIQQQVGEGL